MQTVAWAITFVIGTAIPQVQTIQGLIAAAILLNFSYTFPPLMQLWFDIQADGSREDGNFSPTSGPQRLDTWWQWTRIKRGVFGGGWRRVSFKGFNAIIALAALATCGLGMWGSVSLGLRSRWATCGLIKADPLDPGDLCDQSGHLVWLCGPRVVSKVHRAAMHPMRRHSKSDDRANCILLVALTPDTCGSPPQSIHV